MDHHATKCDNEALMERSCEHMHIYGSYNSSEMVRARKPLRTGCRCEAPSHVTGRLSNYSLRKDGRKEKKRVDRACQLSYRYVDDNGARMTARIDTKSCEYYWSLRPTCNNSHASYTAANCRVQSVSIRHRKPYGMTPQMLFHGMALVKV